MLRRILKAQDAEAAQAIVNGSDDEWTHASGDYLWVYSDSLVELVEMYADHPMIRCPEDMPQSAEQWYEMASKVDWRPQLVREFTQLDQGIVPATVGIQPWLLMLAIQTDRIDLVRALTELKVPVREEHLRMCHNSAIIPLLLPGITITEQTLKYLTRRDVLPYALPYLGSFSTLLAQHCPIEDLENLKAQGIDISDHNIMLRALGRNDALVWRRPPLSAMVFARDNTTTTSDVLEKARETHWYWTLYASEEERQAILGASGGWRPLVEGMFEGRSEPGWHEELLGAFDWRATPIFRLAELVELPAGIVRSIFANNCLDWEAMLLPDQGALPWKSDELRQLLERARFLNGYPWAVLF